MILMITLLEKCGSGVNFDDTDDRVVMDMHKMTRMKMTLLEKKRSGVPLMTLLDTDNTSLMMTLSEKCSNGDYQRTQDDDDFVGEAEEWCPSDDSAHVTPTGLDSHSC